MSTKANKSTDMLTLMLDNYTFCGYKFTKQLKSWCSPTKAACKTSLEDVQILIHMFLLTLLDVSWEYKAL